MNPFLSVSRRTKSPSSTEDLGNPVGKSRANWLPGQIMKHLPDIWKVSPIGTRCILMPTAPTFCTRRRQGSLCGRNHRVCWESPQSSRSPGAFWCLTMMKIRPHVDWINCHALEKIRFWQIGHRQVLWNKTILPCTDSLNLSKYFWKYLWKVFLEELLKYVAYKKGSSAVSAEKRKQHKNDLSLPFEKIIELFWSFIFLKWVAWNEISDLVEMVYLLPAQDTKCNLCKIEEVLCFLLLDFQIASCCTLYSCTVHSQIDFAIWISHLFKVHFTDAFSPSP